MFCAKCGAQLPDGSKFCTKCGTPTGAGEADTAVMPKADATAPQPPVYPSVPQQPAYGQKQRDGGRNGRGVVTGIVVAIVAVAVAAVTFIMVDPMGLFVSSTDTSAAAPAASSQAAPSSDSVAITDTTSAAASGASAASTSAADSQDASFVYEPTIAHIDRAYKEEMSAEHSRPLGYVLAGSDTHVYDRSAIEQLSTDELWYARNELYARYGKGFRTTELKEHFESTPWYYEVYSADDFDQLPDMLNSVEKSNLETILSVERERNSPHLQ